MAKHPNKHIQAAIEYAINNGWTFLKSGPRAHSFGALFCAYTERGGCIVQVFSTPRNAENHARWIRRQVDRCPHS